MPCRTGQLRPLFPSPLSFPTALPPTDVFALTFTDHNLTNNLRALQLLSLSVLPRRDRMSGDEGDELADGAAEVGGGHGEGGFQVRQ